MNKTLAIARKELRNYIQSPIAAVVLFATTIIFNIFFYIIIDENREATLRDVFKVMEFMFIFIVPLLTMKALAEEKQTGTMEFLMTTPTSTETIVLGKYLGSLAFLSLLIFPTVMYYLIIEFYARIDRPAAIIGYIGIWLEGAFFVSVGLMTSAWSRNQIVAAMVSYAILFLLYFSISFIKYFNGPAAAVIRYLGTWSHAENFTAGLVTLSDVTYYLSGIILCLILTRLSMDHKIGNR